MNIKEQEKALREEKSQIAHDLEKLGRTLTDTDDWVVNIENKPEEQADVLDAANQTEELENNSAVFDILEERYEQVARALRAIESGTYGICEEEGCDISQKRLMANPSSTTCIKHAE